MRAFVMQGVHVAGIYHFAIDQGATLDRLITWTNAAGTPYDMTGWTARMQIRERAGGQLYASFTTEAGSIVLGAVDGTIRIKATAAATAAWTWKSGRYDLELVDATGQVTRLLEGTVRLSLEVTV